MVGQQRGLPHSRLVRAACDRRARRRRDKTVALVAPAGASRACRGPGGYPTPSAFSLRCSAERSMPTNSAVREMLPEKRLICAIR